MEEKRQLDYILQDIQKLQGLLMSVHNCSKRTVQCIDTVLFFLIHSSLQINQLFNYDGVLQF